MIENRRLIECIMHPEKTMPSSTYFTVLQMFESITKDTKKTFIARALCLFMAWEKCRNIITSESFSIELPMFMHHATRESAIIILDPGWENITNKIKNDLNIVLRKIVCSFKMMKDKQIEATKYCHFLISLMKNPWSHHNFSKLLYGDPSQIEVLKFIQYEKSNIFVLRLRMLCEGKCENQALKLSSLAMDLYNSNLKNKSQFEDQDYEFIRDIYYACLERANKKKELIGHLMKYSPEEDGKILMENYCKKIQSLTNLRKEIRPRICKNIVLVCEMAAYIMVVNSLRNSDILDNIANFIKKWSLIVMTLMETDLKPDIDYFYIKNMVHTFIDVAPSASHLYLLCDVLYCEFGSKLPRTLYIEIYIKALSANINEKEKCKQLSDKDGSFESLKKLVQGYLKLANLLEDILSICRECVLTAYSLMPSSDLMMRVESLAIKSGKLIPENLTNVVENSCNKSKKGSNSNKPGRKRKSKLSNSYQDPKSILDASEKNYSKIHSDLSELNDPLTPIMQEDLISIIKYPRYGTFNWNLEWPRMKILCQQYLENLDLVIKRNTLQRSDLTYLDIDIDEYNKWTEINMKKLTNDKGYFSSDNNYSDDESIASIASSGEIVSYRSKPSKRRSRKRKVGSRKRKAGSRKRRKVSLKNKPKSITIQTEPRVGLRRSLRYNKSTNIDETDDSTVGSLLNDEAQFKNTNSHSDIEDNSHDSVLEETDKTIIKNGENPKKTKPQLRVIREKRTINKNQHKDFDYSWSLRKKGKSNKNNSIKLPRNSDQTKNPSSNFELPHSSNEHLNMLSERIPQLSSLDFIVPANTDRIVNVVQIQTTSNTLTNVSQTQTERVSNHHSNNEIEKKTSENQTNTHPLDDFVSVYQSNSLNTNINPVQNVGIHQGECSFTGSVSVSNQRVTTDSITNVQTTVQQDSSKPIGTQDVLLDQNQINMDHQHWNDIQLQNSGERLQSSIESAVHLSSNVIVRTSDVINPSHVNQTTGQITYTAKKPSTYCVKTRDRFTDLSLPASISSISTNSNRSANLPLAMNTNKSNFESKIQQNSPIQTSVGLQVNFNNQQSEGIQSIMSPNDQGTQVGTNITDNNSTSTNISLLNDQIMNSTNSRINNSSIVNTSFIKENSFDNLKSNIPLINQVSSIQTQTCAGLRLPNEVSHPNASVISLMIASTQSQVIKSNVHNSAYTSPHNQRMQLNDLSHTSQTNRSDEQKKIDNLKLISQTFTATSEAIKFVTSSTESQRLIQNTDKNSTSNLAVFQSSSEGVSHITQENDPSSKSSNRGRGNMRTYESKTRALKQANMSDMFVFEKGTLYAVQDDIVSHIEPTKSVISPRNNTSTNVKMQNRQSKECLEKPKLSPNASPNITITGSMLPRFQQVFGKTKFPNSTVINDTVSLCSTSVASNLSSNLGPIVNRTNTSTSRVYSSSKGVQTNHDVDTINSNMNCIPPKVVENKLLHTTVNMSKTSSVMALGNNKNNVIMTCKAVTSANNITQVSASTNHQIITSNIEIKKGLTGMPISKVPTTFTTSCINSSIASSSSNLIYSIPILNDSKSNANIEKPLQGVTQLQRQLKMSPSIIQTVLRKHPTWQQNSFRQGKQSTEVQASSIERILPANVANIVKTTIESSNNKISISTIKPNLPETNVSTLMMEQVREFESVLEEVRKTSLMNEMSTASMLPQINHEIIQIPSPTENVDLLNNDSNQTLFPLNKKSNINTERDRCSFSFLNQTLSNVNDLANDDKEPVTIQPTIISVRSVTPTPPLTSPNNNNASVNPVDTQCSKQIANKVKPVIKTPASSPSTSAVKVPVLQKPLPKLQEDEQTTQRIYAILDKYAEQLRNSPELKNKPAPRRRTNPPTNPSMNAKRKKTNQLNLKTCSQQTSCSSSGMEMSPTSDMQAIDSEDSSNAVSHFSHIINSPSRNSDEQSTVISETPLMENTLINVNDVIKKINIEAEMKSKVSQSTQIVVSGASGSFLSIPDGNAANVRLLVAAGNNQKMYRLHCPVTGPGPVVFHQITAKDSCSNDVKMASNIIGQNINESTILSALSAADDIQISNPSLGSEMLHNTLQNFEHKINKPDILLESMEKAQVLDNNEKQLSFPVMKKNQASQSTFSVIHTLPCTPKSEPTDNTEILPEAQNNISESVHKDYCDNEQNTNTDQEQINNSNMNQFVNKQEKLSTTLKNEPPFIPPDSLESSGLPYEDIEFPSFHTNDDEEEETDENLTTTNNKNNQQNTSNPDENKFENTNVNQTLVDRLSDNTVTNDVNNVKCDKSTIVKQENNTSDVTIEERPNILELASPKKEDNKSSVVLDNVTAASAAEIISTVNQTSNDYKQKEELSPKAVKTECESENENENTLSNTVYNMLDNQSASSTHTKIGSLTLRLKNDKSAKNWINCLSKIMLPGTEKMLEGDNLKRLQESFQRTKIKTFKDLKVFVFEQCKKFDNNVETPKEYDLYEDIDGLGVDKPSTNELFPEVAILNDLDKSVSPTLGLLQASTSKSNDTNALQARRKSVLSHTTTSTVIPTGVEQTNVVCKKNKTKVSFLKQALYNEMNQDSNDSETKPFINGIKTVLDSIEQIDSCPESPSNTIAMDSETCMSEDSTSTISSGTPHYNFRKSKRKNVEEDGFIESQVIKRMYRGRTSEENEEKSEPPKLNNIKTQAPEQKPVVEKKECNNRRISSRLKNNNVKNNQHVSNKSPQLDISPCKLTSTRSSLRRVSRKTT
ncbi:protein PF14_0175-like [Rhopalosiphum maidis]|uniref:protein PF14_0175-like n=1 Tax=Rhopalosiphum maidis TaxID=43146 RepID=UPI000F009A8B|nr:protein PF14_0175-like [Rhopalosiphum maidis]